MPADLIAVGVIRKPHGLNGEASVEPWTDSTDRFAELTAVTLVAPDEVSTLQTTIESVRTHAGRALIKFAGIDSPERIGEFRAWTIEIPLSQARPLDQDEYFLHDLVGLKLVDDQGQDCGRVLEAYEGGAGILLSVQRGSRKFDVPFAAGICKSIDLEKQLIVVDLPDGIDEI